jgi:hypothetical protein
MEALGTLPLSVLAMFHLPGRFYPIVADEAVTRGDLVTTPPFRGSRGLLAYPPRLARGAVEGPNTRDGTFSVSPDPLGLPPTRGRDRTAP